MQRLPRLSLPSSALRPWLLALALWGVLATAAALTVWQLGRVTLDEQTRGLRALALALTDDVDRGLMGAEQGLRTVRAAVQEDRLPLEGSEVHAALASWAALMPLARGLWVFDRDAHLLASTRADTPADLSRFAPALDRLDARATAVSRPFVDRTSQETQFALAVRLDEPGARPALGLPPHGTSGRASWAGGWVVVALPASSLLGAFSVALPAEDARMAVFRRDGVRLASSFLTPALLDEPGMAERLARDSGVERRRVADGQERLIALHTLAHYGIQVVMSRDVDAVLASWHQARRLTGIALALLLAVMALALALVQRADRRHARSQQALQAQLGRASKLESLGTLAGAVAHDFNNVLAAIVGYGEMLQDGVARGGTQAHQVERVLQAAARGQSLVERILAFSRGGARASVVFAPAPVIDEVLNLIQPSLRPGQQLQRCLRAPGARMRGDSTQLFEAVMNLCSNALQAMPTGGTLTVALERVQVDATRVLSHSQLLPGHHLALSVSDQGSGITPGVMERLFEPYFTTRGHQAGTGLGLAVVHGVVNEHQGAIDVQSTPGQGARFTLYLPESIEALPPVTAALARSPRGHGQALLVVDDDPALVSLAESLLESLGYAPVGTGDPRLALQMLRDQPGRFAALITDEAMPGLTGTELTAALRRHQPDLPVLLVSGHGGERLAARAAQAGVQRVLGKPLHRAELASALAEVLG